MVINEWLMTIYRSLTMKTLFEASLFWMEVVVQQEGNSCSTKVATFFKSYWKVRMHRAGWVDMGPEKAICPALTQLFCTSWECELKLWPST